MLKLCPKWEESLGSLFTGRTKKEEIHVCQLTVSIPLKNVSLCKNLIPLSFNVSFPISAYANAPVPTIHSLKSRLEVAHALPQGTCLLLAIEYLYICIATCLYPLMFHDTGWSATVDEGHTGVELTSLTLFNLRRHSSSEVPSVFYVLKVFADFSWAVYAWGWYNNKF